MLERWGPFPFYTGDVNHFSRGGAVLSGEVRKESTLVWNRGGLREALINPSSSATNSHLPFSPSLSQLLQNPHSVLSLCIFSDHRMSVQNLTTFGKPFLALVPLIDGTQALISTFIADPFADEGDPLGDSQDVGSQADYIHIRIQQRNGRKTLTTLQGLPKRQC